MLTIFYLLICRCGLTIQAFNMLPAGCLDGGRSVQVNYIALGRLNIYLAYERLDMILS